MNVHLSERAERIARSQVESGRFSSASEAIDEARRQLDTQESSPTSRDFATDAGQELQRKLFAAGIIAEVNPPITDPSPWQGRQAVSIEGESLSEMILRERR